MLIATKKNKQKRIPDVEQKRYESLGWTIKTTDGTLVYAPRNLADEVEALKAQNKILITENMALKAENETLKANAETSDTAEVAEAKTTAKKTTAKKST